MQTTDYLALPYHRIIQPDESGYWSARVLELDGVFSEGDTAAEAAENLNVAMGLWIDHELAAGHAIPRPWGANRSGDIRLRLPRSIHANAALRAKVEGVSLNYLIATAVTAYLSQPAVPRERTTG
jgi:predicted RNase H-like HicB family nuclease